MAEEPILAMKFYMYFVMLVIAYWSVFPVQSTHTERLAIKANQFSFDVYNELKSQNQSNIFFSGFSMYSSLLLLYIGLKDPEKQAVGKVLSVSHGEDQDRFSLLRSVLTESNSKSTKFSTADKVWIDSKYDFIETYSTTVAKIFSSDVLEKVSFQSKPRKSEEVINAWVKTKTNGLIEQLISPGFVNANTKFVITNAVHFKASWLHQFDGISTANRSFEVRPGETVQVPTMAATLRVNFYRDDKFASIIELPYKHKEFSMLILLPVTDPIETVLDSLNSSLLQDMINKMEQWKLRILLPKFKIRSEYYLRDHFKNMGMENVFSSAPDLSSMIKDGRHVAITEVIHKASVSVGEEGTEAGAGTAVISGRSMVPSFVVNKPFAFYIRHVSTGAIVFSGKIGEPKLE